VRARTRPAPGKGTTLKRATVDFGIDLGTTNSEIAVASGGCVQVLRNALHDEATPSVVRIDPGGGVVVGKQAYERLMSDPGNTHAQFKRLMGTQQRLVFERAKKTMAPEELSAEVLKALRQDAKRTLGEEIDAAVITVPAMFEIPQLEATRRAAALAGIGCSPLLQEPIAAALAYGYQAEALDGYLLVYDFGGGTFDCSVLRSDGGQLTVVNHAGDNYLGGKNLDSAVVEHLLPRLINECGLSEPAYRASQHARGKLYFRAEATKIQLSTAQTATLELDGLGRGLEDFEASLTVRRAEYERIVQPIFAKTLDIVERLLAEARLDKKSISQVILVGGPTQTPIARAMVAEALGQEPRYNVDPTTVVAQGAAWFAASQALPAGRPVPVPSSGALPVQLVYDPVSQDEEATLGGRFPKGAPARVQITRADGGWKGGSLAVDGGTFLAPVVLRPRATNEFRIQAFDTAGREVAIAPASVTISHGPKVESAVLSRSVRAGFSDNTSVLLLQKGTPVPCEGRSPRGALTTAKAVPKGGASDLLRIPFLQGEQERADRNVRVGEILIQGTALSRDLPADSEVEIRVAVDRDFQTRFSAYVPLLDQEFDAVRALPHSPLPDVAELSESLELERARLQRAPANPEAAEQARRKLDEMRTQVDRASAQDQDAAEQAERCLREVRIAIDAIEEAGRWPALRERWAEALAFAEMAMAVGQAADRTDLDRIKAEGERLDNSGNYASLERQCLRAEQLGFTVLARQDSFWVEQLQEMSKATARTTQPQRAKALTEEGRLAVDRGDFASLRTIVAELWRLLPGDEKPPAHARFASDLKRKAAAGYL
jgi:molecular chaperone DnaK